MTGYIGGVIAFLLAHHIANYTRAKYRAWMNKRNGVQLFHLETTDKELVDHLRDAVSDFAKRPNGGDFLLRTNPGEPIEPPKSEAWEKRHGG